MKQKLKKLKLLLTISLAGLLLYGCNVEEEKIDNSNQPNVNVKHMKFEELIGQQKFQNAMAKRPKKGTGNASSSANGKTIMEQQYGFTIVEREVNVVQTDSLTSYTMLITRDNSLPNELDNLVVQVDYQNIVKSYLFKYTSNSPITPENYYIAISQGQKTVEEIIYNDTPYVTNLEAPCI